MRKLKRTKVKREWLEGQLFKYERRIQRLAEEAYKFRQAIEILDAQEVAKQKTQEEISNAIRESGIEAAAGSGGADTNSGESELSNNEALKAVLAEQPTELRND